MISHRELVQLGHETIAAAIEVHRQLGPGLLESVYQECLELELDLHGMAYEKQVRVPIVYKGRHLKGCLRVDLLIAQSLILEIKCVETLLDVHKAQLLSQLRLTNLPTGLLINFNVTRLHLGIRRAVNRPGLTLTDSFKVFS